MDEAGNFDFSLRQGASKYFILTSVILDDCSAADALMDLRRQRVWEGHSLTDAFHCTTDKQLVRDQVFALIAQMNIRVDATIFEKRKTIPARQSMREFYKLAWYQHASHVIPLAVDNKDELHVVAASLGTKRDQIQIGGAIRDVVNQCGRTQDTTHVSHWPASTDPCLQIADYCCWAIQRKWEGSDARSHILINHLIRTEYDRWSKGRVNYY